MMSLIFIKYTKFVIMYLEVLMKEKIYYFDNLTSMEEIEKTLISFIGNLVSRK